MRELDILLCDFLDNDYAESGDAQKQAFRRLLALSDPELIGYLLGGQIAAESELADVISTIRNKSRT